MFGAVTRAPYDHRPARAGRPRRHHRVIGAARSVPGRRRPSRTAGAPVE
jgi:hypothetical protein